MIGARLLTVIVDGYIEEKEEVRGRGLEANFKDKRRERAWSV